jgi:hypothetical protein
MRRRWKGIARNVLGRWHGGLSTNINAHHAEVLPIGIQITPGQVRGINA